MIPTGYERSLPPGVQLTVRARRRAMAGQARGTVLDLGGADSHASLWPAIPAVTEAMTVVGPLERRLAELAREGRRYDTVFSVFRMAAVDDLHRMLAHIKQVLADDGTVLFLEPGRRTGLSGRAQQWVSPTIAVTTGWRVDRDIPVELRRAGLSVIDIERHRTGTLQWWLRSLVEGRAHHALATRPDPPSP